MSEQVREFDVQRVAVFSDIHSNYHAFRACYEDARSQGAQGFIFLGDYVSDLAEARKTLELVYHIREKYPTVCLRGNRERYMLECRAGSAAFRPGSKSGSLLYTYEALLERDFRFFEQLPISDTISLFGTRFEIAHATRDNDRHYFDSKDAEIGRVFDSMAHSFLLTGHAHRQYRQTCGGKTIINPGSVGIPQERGNLAQYAILSMDGPALRCNLRQIPYDIGAAIRSQFESGLVELGKYWAISILYDIITGREYTIALLQRVREQGEAGVFDENLWRRCAEEMGMAFTPEEILQFCVEQTSALR